MVKAVRDTKTIPQKLYYSISEVSILTEVKPYVLRFWEKEFPMLKPKKNRSGNRIYQAKEIELVNRIKTLLYDEGFTIEGARQQLRNDRKQAAKGPIPTIKKDLADIKSELKLLIKLLS